eukprot:CAMPEP_0206593160 /NCGR_PEP_ID=MMETSP0325_2-20121206/41471_1 /ASSEMBLY_ACC=CAM_ASM_000347 /TAXON_ID=2866 /ORGANISM="Crypthecodinium cohnii, Strain Seligo" /LENGTH=73 /DNA_ID=CAMNT_0054103093 /DNA_START=174 /DNA_END=392 /DNA_ORIENTATION=+
MRRRSRGREGKKEREKEKYKESGQVDASGRSRAHRNLLLGCGRQVSGDMKFEKHYAAPSHSLIKDHAGRSRDV